MTTANLPASAVERAATLARAKPNVPADVQRRLLGLALMANQAISRASPVDSRIIIAVSLDDFLLISDDYKAV